MKKTNIDVYVDCARAVTKYFASKGLKKFNAKQAHDVVIEFGGVNLSQVYKGHYPDSPIHIGLHILHKDRKDKRMGLLFDDQYYYIPDYYNENDYDLDDLKDKINAMLTVSRVFDRK